MLMYIAYLIYENDYPWAGTNGQIGLTAEHLSVGQCLIIDWDHMTRLCDKCCKLFVFLV